LQRNFDARRPRGLHHEEAAMEFDDFRKGMETELAQQDGVWSAVREILEQEDPRSQRPFVPFDDGVELFGSRTSTIQLLGLRG
jgi:hypothetical protein